MSSAAEKERVKIGEVGPAWSIWLLLLAACGGGGGGSPKVEVTGISNVDDSPDINDTPEPTHTTDPNLPNEHTVPTDLGNRKTPPPQPISPTSPPPDEPTAPPLSSRILSYGTKDKDKFEGTAEMRSVSYEYSNAGVEISLGAAKNSEGYIIGKGGFAKDDQLKDIKNLYGTLYTDTLTGDDDANMIFGLGWLDNLYGLGGDDFLHGGDSADDIEGGAGADTIDGGTGSDWSLYYSSKSSVHVSLSNPKDEEGFIIGHTGGDAAGDRLKNIENLEGSFWNDTLIGDEGDNVLKGEEGHDVLRSLGGHDLLHGGIGADIIDGGEGNDWSSYRLSTAGVRVSLSNAQDSHGYIAGHGGGDATGDRLKDIENLEGSAFDDILIGDDGDNILQGGGGNDRLTGGAGKDVFVLYDVADGVDTIIDFTKGEDIIFLYKESVHQPKNLGEAEIGQDRDGDDLIINFEGQTIFILEGHYLSHNRPLLIADFEFLAFETL